MISRLEKVRIEEFQNYDDEWFHTNVGNCWAVMKHNYAKNVHI